MAVNAPETLVYVRAPIIDYTPAEEFQCPVEDPISNFKLTSPKLELEQILNGKASKEDGDLLSASAGLWLLGIFHFFQNLIFPPLRIGNFEADSYIPKDRLSPFVLMPDGRTIRTFETFEEMQAVVKETYNGNVFLEPSSSVEGERTMIDSQETPMGGQKVTIRAPLLCDALNRPISSLNFTENDSIILVDYTVNYIFDVNGKALGVTVEYLEFEQRGDGYVTSETNIRNKKTLFSYTKAEKDSPQYQEFFLASNATKAVSDSLVKDLSEEPRFFGEPEEKLRERANKALVEWFLLSDDERKAELLKDSAQDEMLYAGKVSRNWIRDRAISKLSPEEIMKAVERLSYSVQLFSGFPDEDPKRGLIGAWGLPISSKVEELNRPVWAKNSYGIFSPGLPQKDTARPKDDNELVDLAKMTTVPGEAGKLALQELQRKLIKRGVDPSELADRDTTNETVRRLRERVGGRAFEELTVRFRAPEIVKDGKDKDRDRDKLK